MSTDLVDQVLMAMDRIEVRVDSAVERLANRVAYGILEYAIEDWPSQAGHGAEVHPYSKDRSYRTWSVTAPEPEVRIIENTSEPSGYITRGYTRQGAKSARSWSRRGMTGQSSYLHAAAQRYFEEKPSDLTLRLDDTEVRSG